MILAMFVTGIRPSGPQKGQRIYKHDNFMICYVITDPDDVTEVCQKKILSPDYSPFSFSLLAVNQTQLIRFQTCSFKPNINGVPRQPSLKIALVKKRK